MKLATSAAGFSAESVSVVQALGESPTTTMIPVRENSEVVIICPDI
jgi:hypothetical protein